MNPAVSPFSILLLGFLLGLKHATDADHVVAVTTIVSKQRKLRHAAMVGVTWGIGHTLMIIVVGIAIIIFHLSIPEKLQLTFEFIVAIALVVLGLLNITGMMKHLINRFSNLHSHMHHHGRVHVHVHDHESGLHEKPQAHEAVTEFLSSHGIMQLVRPFIVGIIHGLAGSAAVALLVLGSITDERIAILYLGIFGIGTIIGMMLITTLLGIPVISGSKKFARFDHIVTVAAGFLSIMYGLYFGYQIGVVEGLFAR
ncbi:high-affinity nickel-transport family protein [Patescibacteria group bacterium]|nr:high-affinity nickel-transport family protein [Patescibacteria group bacterium]